MLTALIFILSEEPGPVMDFKTVLVTKDSCTLSWKKPLSDGGSRIICYVLEVLNGDDKYKELMRSKNMQYSAKDLVEGTEYTYRVKAMNDSGEGAAKELIVVAKDQIGKWLPILLNLPGKSYDVCLYIYFQKRVLRYFFLSL